MILNKECVGSRSNRASSAVIYLIEICFTEVLVDKIAQDAVGSMLVGEEGTEKASEVLQIPSALPSRQRRKAIVVVVRIPSRRLTFGNRNGESIWRIPRPRNHSFSANQRDRNRKGKVSWMILKTRAAVRCVSQRTAEE